MLLLHLKMMEQLLLGGMSNNGGDMTNSDWSNPVDVSDVSNVVQIYSTHYAFAALKNDGKVVTWGASNNGGDITNSDWTYPVDVSDVSNVVQIYSTNHAFAALKNDGTVVSWGIWNKGGRMNSLR